MHLFKCNCPEFYKRASCHHVLLAGMMCDKDIRIPDQYLDTRLQGRRRRGRPSRNPSEVGDVGESRCRIRLALQESYRPPKVCLSFVRERVSFVKEHAVPDLFLS